MREFLFHMLTENSRTSRERARALIGLLPTGEDVLYFLFNARSRATRPSRDGGLSKERTL